jgi:hypothetical protein
MQPHDVTPPLPPGSAPVVPPANRLVDARAKLRPVLVASYVTTSARMIRRGLFGPRRYPGDATAICRAGIRDCWTGDYLAASAGHFRQFWTRDLSYSSAALVRIGEGERLRSSLAWALRAWSRGGAVTTTIFPGRRPLDVHTYGVDSVPLLLHALRMAEGESLIARHASWLGPAIAAYVDTVLDRETGFVRDDRAFATHRDVVVTRSNAYANCMLALLSSVLRETGWFPDPVPPGAADRLVERHWRNGRFVDDPLTDLVAGDATVFPFWLGVVPDDLGLAGALRALRDEGLADPLPLRYVARRDPTAEDPQAAWILPDYQGTAIWSSLGAMYLGLLRRVDPEAAEPGVRAWAELTERDGTFWEVLNDRLQPYVGRFRFFRSDESMLWSSLLVDLLEGRDGAPPGHGTAAT